MILEPFWASKKARETIQNETSKTSQQNVSKNHDNSKKYSQTHLKDSQNTLKFAQFGGVAATSGGGGR